VTIPTPEELEKTPDNPIAVSTPISRATPQELRQTGETTAEPTQNSSWQNSATTLFRNFVNQITNKKNKNPTKTKKNMPTPNNSQNIILTHGPVQETPHRPGNTSTRARARNESEINTSWLRDQTFWLDPEHEPMLNIRLLDKVPIFEGRPEEDINDWLRRAYAVFIAAGVDPKHSAAILPARLTGRALECFHALPQMKNPGTDKIRARTLKEFVNDMAHALHVKRPVGARYADCQSRKKLDQESVREYASDMKRLVKKAYAGFPEQQYRRLILDFFIAGFPAENKRTSNETELSFIGRSNGSGRNRGRNSETEKK
jgi:hypothetical protein